MPLPLQLLVERRGDRLVLRSPAVGTFTAARGRGEVLTPGAPAGVLLCLEVAHDLLVPPGVTGRVTHPPPDLVHAPVGHGDVLYELAPLEAAAEEDAAPAAAPSGALTVRTPHSGRFWHRPTPNDEPLVRVGQILSEGSAVGLIEVMKTFTLLHYQARPPLPDRARVLRIVAEDGAEVAADGVLLEVEPA